jgi:dihydrofolate reductase
MSPVEDTMRSATADRRIAMYCPDCRAVEGDPPWRGWWGENPPYHTPVFVLTHHTREALPMEGGTTFFFVTDGIWSALDQAKQVAGDRDVALGGGANVL